MTGEPSVERQLRIINVKGLHARASAKFVETVERFAASAMVEHNGLFAGGDSIMGLLTLGASVGTTIHITTRGSDAVELMDALDALVTARFNEDM